MGRKALNIDRCPNPRELQAYARRRLIGKRNEEVFLHLKHCAKCLRALAKLTRVPSPADIIEGRRPGWWQRLTKRPHRR